MAFALTFAFGAMTACTSAKSGGNNSTETASTGTASSSANSETSEAQTAAPDAIVRELYKLHDANKSPLIRLETVLK